MRKKSSENVRELKRRLETQKKNIMNTICKFLCAAAGLALIPAAGAFAQSAADYDSRGPWARPASGNAAYGNDDYAYNPEAAEESSGAHAIALKAFYALGLEAPDKELDSRYSDAEVDLGGLTFEYAYDFSAARGPVSAELILAASVGYGSVDYNGGLFSGLEVEMLSFDLETGVNLSLNAGERFSLFFGPRVGLNLLYVSMDMPYRYYHSYYYGYKDDETEAGLLYSGDVGFTIKFTDHSGLTATVGYRASTAQPLEIEEQSWVRFSIGYKHTF